ncbi:S1C family serine protease [Paenibacillus harenae]|uniref:S1C family serine protease n=1 Tax=Paenibacillus harenae TaxID=306543 RepID=UPI00278EC0EC|nr:trypsin-like peptidase domain-containing protein [Paenibacillus harenae]MDQ0063080.1 S1-C subfamily serine protease [Paenibacillus harenae]
MNEKDKYTAHNGTSHTNTQDTMGTKTSTTYVYDSQLQKKPSELQASYEKELGMHMDLMSVGGGHRSKRSHNSTRTMLASFLIGAMVVGGFAYAADRNNLFSGGSAAAGSGTAQVANGSAQQDAGLTTASLGSDATVAQIYEAASPAVVKIETYTEASRQSTMMDDPLFRQFFGGERGGEQGREQEEQQPSDQSSSSELALSGSGTGFFFESDGYILTNEHVVSGAKEVKVTVQGYDEPLTAQVVGSSYELDLAVLKVTSPDGKAFPSLELGNSDETRIGDSVIAIGNPYGFDQTMTMGVLSAKERPITIADDQGEHEYEHLLQTDASINPGNSGGPLLNEEGQVIGINTAVNAEAQGIGFAIPTTTISKVLEQLKTNTL